MANSMLGAEKVLQKYSAGQFTDTWHQKTFISTRWIKFLYPFDALSTQLLKSVIRHTKFEVDKTQTFL